MYLTNHHGEASGISQVGGMSLKNGGRNVESFHARRHRTTQVSRNSYKGLYEVKPTNPYSDGSFDGIGFGDIASISGRLDERFKVAEADD